MGSSAPGVDAQQVFKRMFQALIKKYYSTVIDIERYEAVLEQQQTKGYNSKILVSSTDIKIGSKGDINKDLKKLPPPVSGKAEDVAHVAPK